MIKLQLLLNEGHSAEVELDEGTPVLGDLVGCLARLSADGSRVSEPKLFNLTCQRTNQSILFSDRSLVGIISSEPLELCADSHMKEASPLEGARHVPIIIIDDFLSIEDNRLINSFIMENSRRFKLQDDKNSPQTRHSRIAEDILQIRERMMIQILPLLPAITATFNVSYRSIESFGCEITAYSHGDYKTLSTDLIDLTHIPNKSSFPEPRRLISYEYHVHTIPRKFTGGTLRFFDPKVNDGRPRTVKPCNNRIIFFPSQISYEVTPVKMKDRRLEVSRISVNGWIGCYD